MSAPAASSRRASLLRRWLSQGIQARVRPETALFAALIVVFLLPIWVFRYIPTQDGPSHLYNSQVLVQYLNPASIFRQFYDLRLSLFPNWLTYLLLAALMLVVPALVAEKILLSLYVILFPLSVWYLLDAIRPGKTILALASFGLVYNYLLLMGFYNFVFSLPLVLFAVGYWLRHRKTLGVKEIILINLLCALVFFGHIVGYVVTVLAIGFLAACFLVSTGPRTGFSSFLKTLASILPSGLLFLNYYLGSNVAAGLTFDPKRIPGLLQDLATMRVLVSYDDLQARFAYGVAALFGLLVLYTLGTKIFRKGSLASRFSARDLFFPLCLILLGLYLALPWAMGPGGWLNDRLALMACLLLLPWFAPLEGRALRIGFAALATLVALANVGYIFYAFNHFAPGLAEFNSGVRVIQKDKIVLPLYYDGFGGSKRVGVYVNASSYYTLDNSGINLSNYEVQFDYFPVKFKDSFVPPIFDQQWVERVKWSPDSVNLCYYASHLDYVEVWGNIPRVTRLELDRCYIMLFEQGQQRIYAPNAR